MLQKETVWSIVKKYFVIYIIILIVIIVLK